jgi:hypothetical protein
MTSRRVNSSLRDASGVPERKLAPPPDELY